MRWIALLLLSLVMPACAGAQKTEDEITARLVGKPLYLRGQWSKDKLEFDGQGHLAQAGPLATFTLSGVKIDKVKLTSKELVLEGTRVGLEFTRDVPTRVILQVSGPFGSGSREAMTIRIKPPDDGDFTVALDAIFTDSLAGFNSPLPECWRKYAQKHSQFFEDAALAPVVAGDLPLAADLGRVDPAAGAPRMDKVDRSVTPPVPIKTGEPGFTPSARALRYPGKVLVNLVVGMDGIPAKVNVVRPVGLGLDEAAVAAVSLYRFTPAMKDGEPVPVELNVEVNFQIF